MTALLLVAIASTALWYLAGMALITRWLWSRYPAWLDAWATCPACSGTWYAAAIYAYLWRSNGADILGVVGIPGIVAAALAGTVLTPLLAALIVRALDVTGVGSRANEPPPGPDPRRKHCGEVSNYGPFACVRPPDHDGKHSW